MLEVARENGIKDSTYFSRLSYGWSKERAANDPLRETKYDGDYAVYRKGEMVAMGTLKECAEALGISEQSIDWHTTPAGIRRREARKNPEMAMAVIKLDIEEADESV